MIYIVLVFPNRSFEPLFRSAHRYLSFVLIEYPRLINLFPKLPLHYGSVHHHP